MKHEEQIKNDTASQELTIEQTSKTFCKIQSVTLIAFSVALIPYLIFVLIGALSNKGIVLYLKINFYVIATISMFLLALLPITIFYRLKYLRQNRIKINVAAIAPLILLFFALIYSVIATVMAGGGKVLILGNSYNREGLLTVFMYAIFFLSAFFTTDPKVRKAVLITVVSVSVTTNFVLILLKLFDAGADNAILNRKIINGLFNNSNHWGYYASFTAIIAACGIVYFKKIAHTVLSSIALAVTLTALLISHTLGSNIAFLLGLIFIYITYFLSGRKLSYRLILPIAISLVVFLVSELTSFSTIIAEYIDLIGDIGDVSQSGATSESGGQAGSGRMKLWLGALETMKAYPWFGKGLDVYYSEIFPYDMPHNEYLQIASGVGIPTLVLYLAAILYTYFYALFNRKKLSSTALICLTASFTYCVSAFFGNTFHYTYPYFLMSLAFSLRELTDVDADIKSVNPIVSN